MSEESNPRTLYVGNLDASVSEDLLCALFSQIGQVKGCKIIREPGNDPYAFVEFTNHQCAATALAAMNKRLFLDKEMKVSPGIFLFLFTSHFSFLKQISPGKIPFPSLTLDPWNKKSRFLTRYDWRVSILLCHGDSSICARKTGLSGKFLVTGILFVAGLCIF